jgi:integrase
MTLIELLENHYSVHRIVSKSYDESIRNVIRAYEQFRGAQADDPLAGKAVVTDLSDDRLNKFAAWLLKSGRSRATANKNLRTLIALANFARTHGFATYRPDVAKIPEARQTPVCWRPEEFARLIGAIHQRYKGGWWGRTLFAVVMVTYDTGLRLIDSLSIESNPEDFSRGVVYVTERKTQQRRSFVLHEETLAAVRNAFGAFQGGRVVRYPYKETNPLRKRLRAALATAELPTDRKQLFQKIRRLTANEARRAGLSATEVLGHSASWVTEKFYLDPDAAPPLDVANRIRRPNIRDERESA